MEGVQLVSLHWVVCEGVREGVVCVCVCEGVCVCVCVQERRGRTS